MTLENQLDIHFMRIVNMCRDGVTDDEIRITAEYCGLPQLWVWRIAHDMHVLTPEQLERYTQILEKLK